MAQTQTVDTNKHFAQNLLHDHLHKCNDDPLESGVTYSNGLPEEVDIAFLWFVSKARKHSCQGAFLFNTGLHTPLHVEQMCNGVNC